jgi:hypothetical protein
LRKPLYYVWMYVRESGLGMSNERRSRTFRWCAFAMLFLFSSFFFGLLKILSILLLLLLLPDCA